MNNFLKKWRPIAAIVYLFICLFDFVFGPIWWTYVQLREPSLENFRQWVPLTLQGAGLFHLAMGALLGITAYGKTQESLRIGENKNENI